MIQFNLVHGNCGRGQVCALGFCNQMGFFFDFIKIPVLISYTEITLDVRTPGVHSGAKLFQSLWRRTVETSINSLCFVVLLFNYEFIWQLFKQEF